ncbi:MAG: DHH family phosphoesterase [Bacillota bacterium]|nr:DHH family phosphoesterase [Bacillota bacterium]
MRMIDWILIILAALMAAVLTYFDFVLGGIALFAVIVIVPFVFVISKNERDRKHKEIQDIVEGVDTEAKYTVQNLPLPVVIVSSTGTMTYYNSLFSGMFPDDSLIGQSIFDFIAELQIDFLQVGFHQEEVQVNKNIYSIFSSKVPGRDDTILYFMDTTDYVKLSNSYQDNMPVVFHISVDNLDEVSKDLKDDRLPFIKSEIEKVIYRWGGGHNALVKRLSADKFLVIANNVALRKVEQLKFAILDDAREIDAGNKMPITFSIGVGYESDSLQALEAEAYSCLEIALGRGGDQAVLRKGGNYEYYGGKTKAVEKRNRVKARVIAHGVRSLIKESGNVIIMGHRYPDMDSFGACVGVYRAVRLLGGNPYIVMTGVTAAIEAVYSTFADNEEYSFVTGEEALSLVEDDSLLVVVDTHKTSICDFPPLVDAVERVVVIDHHRRGAEFIDKAVVKYVEPYSSSTCELVTEVLQYITEKPALLPEEADALLAGIIVDTKNFSLRTGTRTFEAASFLRRSSADPIKVRQLFQDDLEVFRTRAIIVGEAERYRGDIAVASTRVENAQIQLIAAQAANDLLDIKGILASFVIGRSDSGMTFISGRSLGEVNVQIILETIGGGGHLEVAGAQFKDKTVEEVKAMLIDAIDQYYQSSEEER